VIKMAIFGLTHGLKHRITRKLFKIDRYMLRGGLASIELSFHPCNILHDSRMGVSRGNKNVGCGTPKRLFFTLVVLITGKTVEIDGYMLRDVWQALNSLSIYVTYCMIVA